MRAMESIWNQKSSQNSTLAEQMGTSAAATTSASSDAVTAPLPTASAHPPRATFLRPSHPPLFLGRPINPNPGGSGTAPLYPPVGPARAFQHRPVGDRLVTVANPAGYIRNSSPTAVMSLQAQAQAQAQAQGRPFVFAAAAASGSAGDPAAHVQQHPGAHPMRPLHLQQHQFVVPRQQLGHSAPPRTASVAAAAQPKVAPFPTVSSAPENNLNDRDKSREDTVVVIHDRKVRLSEGSSGSLYTLCRSWVRNGSPQESQPTIGENLKILPKPLPASVVNLHLQKKSEDANEDENSDKYEDLDSVEQLSARDLLKGHIKHAKKVRSRLRKERLLRIERYKQRLSLLLPTQIELIGRNETTPGS